MQALRSLPQGSLHTGKMGVGRAAHQSWVVKGKGLEVALAAS